MKDVRKLLSDALLEICERKSLDHVTVTEIAAHAGLTRQVFYRYFFDKYDLAKFIHICDFYSALDAIISNEDCDTDVWIKVCNTWLDVIKARPQFYQNIYHSSSNEEFKKMMRTYNTNFYMGVAQYQLGPQIDPEVIFVIQMYLAGVTEKINDWILAGAKMPINELNRLLQLGMPERIQDLVMLRGLDGAVAKKIVQDAYPESQALAFTFSKTT